MSKPEEETKPPVVDAEMKDAASPAEATTAAEGSFDIEDRRRLKHMAYVTSGCSKNKEKDRIIGTFWEETWPRLVKLGWKKVEGEGSNAGTMNFFPKGVTEEGTTKGRDYYDRIKDVLDRLREKRTTSEGSVIEDFDAEVYRREEEENKASRTRKGGSSDGETSGSKKSAKLDSWKEGRKFTKKTSRVGPNYQPESIPDVGEKSAVEEEP